MNEAEMMSEIRDANLNYLMLSQQMIRTDKATAIFRLGISKDIADPVSYTHLDVYKRQAKYWPKCDSPLAISTPLSVMR